MPEVQRDFKHKKSSSGCAFDDAEMQCYKGQLLRYFQPVNDTGDAIRKGLKRHIVTTPRFLPLIGYA